MAKKVTTKKPKEQMKKVVSAPETANEKSYDFGGLPDRNLKKNLGC